MARNEAKPTDESRRRAVRALAGAAVTVGVSPTASTIANAAELATPVQGATGLTSAITTFSVGAFLVDVSNKSIRIRHRTAPQKSLWETGGFRSLLQIGTGEAVFREHGNPLGTFDVDDVMSSTQEVRSIASVTIINGNTLQLNCDASRPGVQESVTIVFTAVEDDQLRFVIDANATGGFHRNRIILKYASSADEAFFGFGQQLTFFNQKGKVLPILVQEHGIGRGLPGITFAVNQVYDGAGGTPYLTEAPVPHYITNKLRSLFLENHEYSQFDLRADNAVEMTLFSGMLVGRIVFGLTPLALIKSFTAYSGRMRRLPDWIHNGVIVAAQGGSPKVDALLTDLVAANVPISALWIQDWSGTKPTGAGTQVLWNWQLNSCLYPGWEALVNRLETMNARVLLYMNPFLVPTLCSDGKDACGTPSDCVAELYQEAEHNGYFVRQNDKTFTYINSTIRAGMLDLSNREAREWTKNLILRELIGKGRASGWMCDFGEALPFDAQLYGSADPNVWHNHYPEAWAQLHREAIDATGRGEEFVFWNRSGYTRSPKYATSFWLGDQLQTWDRFDGIKTAVVGMLSGGISGFSLLHSDTGGFVAYAPKGVPVIFRTKELLLRWMELNAFTTIFRTHEGLIPTASAQVDTDNETKAHLARFGEIYRLLAPYRKLLVDEAAEHGYPVVRHPFLHYPDDPNVLELKYEFLLGSELLIAPVLDPRVAEVSAYLPAGNWIHLWSGQEFLLREGSWVKVAAPIGQPGVFFQNNSDMGQALHSAVRQKGWASAM